MAQKLDWMTHYGFCHKCRDRICVYTKFEQELQPLESNDQLQYLLQMKYYESRDSVHLPICDECFKA